MKISKLWMSGCCALVLMACSGEPRINASSMEALNSSIDEITESLSPERQDEFEMAVLEFMASTGVYTRNDASEADILREIRSGLHRKTADEIIREYGR